MTFEEKLIPRRGGMARGTLIETTEIGKSIEIVNLTGELMETSLLSLRMYLWPKICIESPN